MPHDTHHEAPNAADTGRVDLNLLPSRTVHCRAGGREWALQRYADLETLWEAMGSGVDPLGGTCFDDDERLPYWCEIWPSSIALGDWLAEQADRIRGRRCLDMGCGLGLTALVGAAVGARVTGMDYEWPALHYAARNAAANLAATGPDTDAVQRPEWVLMDWRYPAVRPRAFDVVWAGDVVYEARFAEPVADFLLHALAPGGVAWIAEPGRTVYDTFPAVAHTRGLRARKVFTRQVESVYTDTICGDTDGKGKRGPAQAAPGPKVTVAIWAIDHCADDASRT